MQLQKVLKIFKLARPVWQNIDNLPKVGFYNQYSQKFVSQ